VAALTASESRVTGLAAAGLRNREIAQRLFVTPKTVEVHLSSAYRKLGISGRDSLAAALRGDPAERDRRHLERVRSGEPDGRSGAGPAAPALSPEGVAGAEEAE
ncbi:MAG: helix-turn-helix transcriptional regulator, partial [Nocardioides sp.]|uniref:helix-turn-helix domain-containing protein n=1 Tax=Nocardioides sp. TaxID=35761 RepID=UPI0039E4A5BE